MVQREEVSKEVQETIEIIEVGRWYIAEGEYEGFMRTVQGESKEEAVDTLISRIYQRAKRAEKRKRDREFREEQIERCRELSDTRTERFYEIVE